MFNHEKDSEPKLVNAKGGGREVSPNFDMIVKNKYLPPAEVKMRRSGRINNSIMRNHCS